MSDPVHAKTFGPNGSYPNAVCGFKGGQKGRMRFCRPDLLPAHPEACQPCKEMTWR